MKTLPPLVLLILLGTSIFSVHAAVQGNSQDYTISNIEIGTPAPKVSTPSVKPKPVPAPAPVKTAPKSVGPKISAPKITKPILRPAAPEEKVITSTAQILQADMGQVFQNEVTATQTVMSSATLPTVISGALMLPGTGSLLRHAAMESSNYSFVVISVVICLSAALMLLGYKLVIVKKE